MAPRRPEGLSADMSDITAALDGLVEKYPEPLRAGLRRDVGRIAYHIDFVRTELGRGQHCVCDLGGGIGPFTPGCALLDMAPMLVDDFGDSVNAEFDQQVLPVHRSLGVEVVKADALDPSLSFAPGSFDAVTCFEAMEHWSGSPRQLFQNAIDWLKPGGLFLLSAPNCVDLKRRVTVPFGFGKWSDFDSWYGSVRFRGHVRECDSDDLRRIADDLRLTDVRVFGRNWWPDRVGFIPIRALARMLQIAPTLCSTLYLSGRKAT